MSPEHASTPSASSGSGALRDAAIAYAAVLATALVAGLVTGDAVGAASLAAPSVALPLLAWPLALSTLRRRRPVAAAAYAAAALLSPLAAYWGRFPYLVGQFPAPGDIGIWDALSGLPFAFLALFLLRRPDPSDGVPGPMILLDALQAVVAACLLGLLGSAVARGGLFGPEYLMAGLALAAGALKTALPSGAVAAVATLVLLRERPTAGSLALAAAYAAILAAVACSGSPASSVAWSAGFALTLIAYLSRVAARRPRTRPGIPAVAAAGPTAA